jgi:TetR/AcrR family hemagglutinin/protease transcriptional regulator
LSAAIRPARTRLSPEARRAQLLECAIAAFAEHGLARATHSHVAKRAGVSVPAVHSYFRTRDALVTAVLDEVEAFLFKLNVEALGSKGSVRESLELLATRFAREALEKPDIVKVWLDWSTGVRADVWPRYMAVLDRLHGIAQKVFARGKREGVLSPDLNPKAAARVYLGAAHMVALMQLSGSGTSARELDTVIAHIVTGAMNMGREPPG